MFRGIILFMLGLALAAQTPDAERARVAGEMDAGADYYGRLSRQIWELAELGYKENRSAALLKDELRKAGFTIRDNIGGIPTAFVAEWGSGKPVVGIMGEYDALPGLSQDAVPERKPLIEGGSGHGCGHNLLGVAAAFAAITVKQRLAETGRGGTVRFYGAPAEEGGSGKVYMIRAGAFEGTDVVFTWHPGHRNQADLSSSLAIISARFRFSGTPAHAAIAPHAGRSALDAVLLMNHATELLREHIPTEARLHYIITNGGAAPNIVPDFAEAYYYARHPRMGVLDGIWERVVKCAEAGALATETRLEVRVDSSAYEVLPNDTLTRLLQRNLGYVGGVKYTPEEEEFAARIAATLPESNREPLGSQEKVFGGDVPSMLASGSTDVGDVSWVLPAVQFSTATWAPGVPAHTWQSTACSGMSIGRKGMMVAAKTMALSALDVFHDPKLVEAAWRDFQKRKGDQEYRSRIPEGQKPPLNYRDR
jgi:aminobenzoyl-glutamate utilization protein B